MASILSGILQLKAIFTCIIGMICRGPIGATAGDHRGLDPETGLIVAAGYKTVAAYCIGCHTAKMVREYGANRDEWRVILVKMQKIGGRWKLDFKTEEIILEYLSKNYPR